MTPSGATAAARRAAPRRRPSRGRGAGAPATAPAAPRAVPRVPRRVSGPARPRAARRGRATLGARALAGLRGLPDTAVVVRLVRGRLWIGLVACLLLGLVAMQVSLLKLNAGIGRAVQQGANLERRNGELRAEISRLGAEERIQSMGARLGLIMPDAGRVTYLSSRGGQDATAAIGALRASKLGPAAAAPPQAAQDQPAAQSDQSAAQPGQSASQSGQSTALSDQTAPADPGGQSGQATGDPGAAPAAADPSAAGGAAPQG